MCNDAIGSKTQSAADQFHKCNESSKMKTRLRIMWYGVLKKRKEPGNKKANIWILKNKTHETIQKILFFRKTGVILSC